MDANMNSFDAKYLEGSISCLFGMPLVYKGLYGW